MKQIHFFLLIATITTLLGCGSASQSLKRGIKQYQNGEWQNAINDLGKGIVANPVQASYLLGESYRLSNRLPDALPFYEKAIAAGSKADDIYFHYANALKATGKYTESIVAFEQFLKIPSKNKNLVEQARLALENLEKINKILATKHPIELQNLEGINTVGAEFAPVLQGKTLIFTASRKDQVFKSNGQGMLALYKTTIGEKPSQTNAVELFSNNILQDDVNEGTPVFSKDGKTVIFARGNNGKRKGNTLDVDLYIAKLSEMGWSDPLRISVSDSMAWDGAPALSLDGKTLYFCSNRAGGVGGIDIYRANIDNAGRFGKPVNMGRTINTPANEMFPWVSPDAKLYFASDGHAGLGQLDIFMAIRKDGDIYVENLGLPFNSTGDDFGLVLADSTRGYFASNRLGGKGDDDIYYFQTNKAGNVTDIPVVNIPPSHSIEDSKTVRYFLAGSIADEQNTPLDAVKLKIIDNLTGEVLIETTTPSKFGKFQIKPEAEYSLVSEKEGFLTKRQNFSTIGKTIPKEKLVLPQTDTTFTVAILMAHPEVNKEISKLFDIAPIYYNLDKSDIRIDASVELDKIVQILNDNPGILLELGSHTDSRASTSYNQKLSQRRADAAVAYIISKGITPNRIIAKGYGESQLQNGCTDGVSCSEEQHQQNRRTEFKILKN